MSEKTNGNGKASTSMNELDVISAIEAHVRWKIRLEAYISGEGDEKLDPDVVCKDDVCALGQWIYGSGNEDFGHTEQFSDLKSTHADFHRAAADIIRESDKGEKGNAMKMLNEGEYAKYSHRVKTMLARVWLEDNK